jgi:hypothetical protein
VSNGLFVPAAVDPVTAKFWFPTGRAPGSAGPPILQDVVVEAFRVGAEAAVVVVGVAVPVESEVVASIGLPGASVVVSGAEVSLPSTSVDMTVVQSVTLVSGTPPSSPVVGAGVGVGVGDGTGVGEGAGFCA